MAVTSVAVAAAEMAVAEAVAVTSVAVAAAEVDAVAEAVAVSSEAVAAAETVAVAEAVAVVVPTVSVELKQPSVQYDTHVVTVGFALNIWHVLAAVFQ